MGAQTFRDLIVHQQAHELVLEVYRMTKKFPKEELFGLTSQRRRAAVSVHANIAEGFVKRGRADKLRYYNIAQGSLEEVRYYFLLSHDLQYADTIDVQEKLDRVSRMLEGYIRAIASNRTKFFSILFWLLAPGFWLLSYNTSTARG